MLTSLYLKNYILIKEAEVHFHPGLNIVTGESGAGKSILVGALAQMAGGRGSSDMVRGDERKAVIEARFTLEEQHPLWNTLRQNELERNGDELIIRKEIGASGTSRIFINDTPVSLQVLNSFSRQLVDLHGQHQHQKLLHPENHLSYLDLLAANEELREAFAKTYRDYLRLDGELRRLRAEKETARQTEELYRFQIAELQQHRIDEADPEALREELRRLQNYEKIHQSAGSILNLLYENDISLSVLLKELLDQLRFLGSVDKEFDAYRENVEQGRTLIEDAGQFTERYLSSLEFDPQRAEYLRQRVSDLDFLLKKYQKSDIGALRAFGEELNEKLETIANVDHFITRAEKELNERIDELNRLGAQLSRSRVRAAEQMHARIHDYLKDMAMADSSFNCDLITTPVPGSPFRLGEQALEISEEGFETARFMFTANPGEAARPLHKIASGGELSRIMLAIKSLLAARDKTPLLVFDEIDSGISGKTARITGKKISELAGYHQLICVTHLPQIAAFADHHIRVYKSSTAHSTEVRVDELDSEARIEELAGLLGGEEVSSQSRANARELLTLSGKYPPASGG